MYYLPTPSLAKSYVEEYLYIHSIHPSFIVVLIAVPGMTITAGKYVKIFSRVDDFENSRFWHSSFCRLGNFHVKNNLQVNSPESMV